MSPQPPTLNIVRNVISLYRTPLMEVIDQVRVHQHHASSVPIAAPAARGQLLHGAADRLRRRRDRHSTASSCAARTRSARARFRGSPPSGTTYDSGDFPAILKQALEASDWKGFNKRKRESKKRGKLRGIGVGCYLEVTAPANKEMGGIALRRRRRRHHPHRHARLRPGPRLAVRPGAEREARRAVREDQAAAGRQRRAAGRRRHRRLALDDEFAARRSSRPRPR